MKKLITSFTGGHLLTLDDFRHTQEAVYECLNAQVLSLLPVGTDRCILFGCALVVTGSDFSLSAGAIYYQGETYLVDAQIGVVSGLPYWVIDISYAAGNPVRYEDGVLHEVHQIRKTRLVYGAGDFLFSSTATLKTLFIASIPPDTIMDLVYVVGEHKQFRGNVTAHFDLATGLAKSTSRFYGKWALADGRNGTINTTGKSLVGVDSRSVGVADTDFDTIGKTGGQKEVTLNVSQMPNHSHPITTGGDTTLDDASGGYIHGRSNADDRIETNHNTGSTGGGQAHENMSPFIVVCWIEKIA